MELMDDPGDKIDTNKCCEFQYGCFDDPFVAFTLLLRVDVSLPITRPTSRYTHAWGAPGSLQHAPHSIQPLFSIYTLKPVLYMHRHPEPTSPPLARLPRHGVRQRRIELDLVQLLGAGQHLGRQLDGGGPIP